MGTEANIILASKSRARQTMLKNAGLKFEAIPSGVNEPAIVKKMQAEGFESRGIALELAKQKALDVSAKHPGALVIGSDQTLKYHGAFIEKAIDNDAAVAKLKMMRGGEHTLISAVSVVKDSTVLWQHIDDAHLTMRDFDDEFLALYCEKAGDALTSCVGAYEFEGLGAWLFDSIKGDFFTILGMPLLPLLKHLREAYGVKP